MISMGNGIIPFNRPLKMINIFTIAKSRVIKLKPGNPLCTPSLTLLRRSHLHDHRRENSGQYHQTANEGSQRRHFT